MTVKIRKIKSTDEPRWRELWDGYTRFYEREPSETLTRHTWARIMDPASPFMPWLLSKETGELIGIANYIIHETTLDTYTRVLPARSVCRPKGRERPVLENC